MMTALCQTGALFLDSYREINARKMFWVVLILSALVVAAFAAVGITQNGLQILWIQWPSVINTKYISRATFYKNLFLSLGVGFWLTWAAMILALISTASIFPDFISGGSIDLYLSKPLSRLRLFLTKYLAALLFVVLQVTVFSVASFLVIGLRASVWEPRLFWAVPVVALVFSYLFCICTLLGLLTRSTVAALLLTVLFWLAIFGIDATEKLLLLAKTAGEIETVAYQRQFEYFDKQISIQKDKIANGDSVAGSLLETSEKSRRDLESKKLRTDPGRRNVINVHKLVFAIKTALPKTGDTNALLERWLAIDLQQLEEERLRQTNGNGRRGSFFSGFGDRTEVALGDPEVARKAADLIRSRTTGWVMGTSLGFEGLVLLLASWIFCRRDY